MIFLIAFEGSFTTCLIKNIARVTFYFQILTKKIIPINNFFVPTHDRHLDVVCTRKIVKSGIVLCGLIPFVIAYIVTHI